VTQVLLFFRRDFVIGHANAVTPAAVLLVESHHGMSRRGGAGEEIQNHCFRFFCDEEPQCIFDGIERFRKWKSAPWKNYTDNVGAARTSVVRTLIPDADWVLEACDS